jgi:hypothetical protein
LTRRWREVDSNPRPIAWNPAFLRPLEPRLQPICTPIMPPLRQRETHNLDLSVVPRKGKGARGQRLPGLIRRVSSPDNQIRQFLGNDMSESETQKGSLRKRNLPKPSTLRDLRPALIEYRHSNQLWAPPGSMEIVDVRALDGQRIEPDEYWLHVEEERR